jgi:hypothetical protein
MLTMAEVLSYSEWLHRLIPGRGDRQTAVRFSRLDSGAGPRLED